MESWKQLYANTVPYMGLEKPQILVLIGSPYTSVLQMPRNDWTNLDQLSYKMSKIQLRNLARKSYRLLGRG